MKSAFFFSLILFQLNWLLIFGEKVYYEKYPKMSVKLQQYEQQNFYYMPYEETFQVNITE